MAVPNTNLTSTQQHALDVYRRLTAESGQPPSVRELAAALGTSHTSAHALVGKLRDKGYLGMKPVTVTRLMPTTKGQKKR